MGDRCWIQFIIATRDKAKFEDHFGTFDMVTTCGENDQEMILEDGDANNGLLKEREEGAKNGLAFYGRHGEGGEYGPYAFAAFNGLMVEVATDHEGHPVARVEKDGAVQKAQIAECVAYFDVEARVISYINQQ